MPNGNIKINSITFQNIKPPSINSTVGNCQSILVDYFTVPTLPINILGDISLPPIYDEFGTNFNDLVYGQTIIPTITSSYLFYFSTENIIPNFTSTYQIQIVIKYEYV